MSWIGSPISRVKTGLCRWCSLSLGFRECLRSSLRSGFSHLAPRKDCWRKGLGSTLLGLWISRPSSRRCRIRERCSHSWRAQRGGESRLQWRMGLRPLSCLLTMVAFVLYDKWSRHPRLPCSLHLYCNWLSKKAEVLKCYCKTWLLVVGLLFTLGYQFWREVWALILLLLFPAEKAVQDLMHHNRYWKYLMCDLSCGDLGEHKCTLWWWLFERQSRACSYRRNSVQVPSCQSFAE